MYRVYAKGMIEVITGPMFSGKSEELIKRVKILGHARINTLVAKPAIDTRWDKEKILSRAGSSIETVGVKNTKELKEKFESNQYAALAIDEIQFLDEDILPYIISLANEGVRVIVSGLDMDYTGKPFGIMPTLLAQADLVDKQQAVCNQCGVAATMTFRKTNGTDQVQIGNDEYEPRCRVCHYQGMLKKHFENTQEILLKKSGK